ncbi:MAG: family 1 glycosylhydrolase [Planifilum fimeticola]
MFTGRFYWAAGIEDTFVPQGGPGKRPLDEYELTQHDRKWREDLDLCAGLGIDALRYGIPWYKVQPKPDFFEWGRVDEAIGYILEKGIEPIVDLLHYGTPLWMDRQFLNPSYPEWVSAYARAFAERYAGRIRMFTPVNEPFIHAEFCGRTGRWPPEATGDRGFILLMKNIAKGAIRTVQALREAIPDSVMVHVEATGWFVAEGAPVEASIKHEWHRRFLYFDLITGRVDSAHPLYSWLLENGMEAEDLEWFRRHRVDVDIMGLNYYPDLSVFRMDGDGPRGIWGGTWALEELLVRYHRRYGRPLWITDTSTNGTDAERLRWLEASTDWVLRKRETLPIVGYTWWPLFDLVNWDYREGGGDVEAYLEPMGLWRLEKRPNGELERVRTPVADAYRRVIREDKRRGGASQPRGKRREEEG